MNKIIIPTICVAALTSCNSDPSDKSSKKPNILIIYADDIGYGDISAYGSELIKTPHTDALAEGGIRFTSA